MANTVNGQSPTITIAQRELVDIDPCCFRWPQHGSILRARVSLDGAGGDIVIDDPSTANPSYPAQTKNRIYIVGLEYSGAAATLIIKSKVGAASAIQLSKFILASNGGIILPIRGTHALSPTDPGGALIFNVNAAVDILVHYVIAQSAVFGGNN